MVTYTFTNGTVADATEVNQNFIDVTPKFYYNLTSQTITPNDTDNFSVTIPQNDLGNSGIIVINATSYIYGDVTGDSTTKIKLYVGGVLKKTITRTTQTDANGVMHDIEGSVLFIEENVDTSSTSVDVEIRATNNGLANVQIDALTVVGYKL